MTIEKEAVRPHSPVHVHVDDDTPVHVHVKKPSKKNAAGKSSEAKVGDAKIGRSASNFSSSNLRRSTSAHTKTGGRSRSKSPIRGPWVPPPAKTTSNKYAWQGASHRLEIPTPNDEKTPSLPFKSQPDLDTEDEDRLHGHMKKYENKIDSLMDEVGTLKSEVELQRNLREVDERADAMESSMYLQEQQEELDDYRRELQATERENHVLRKSMELLREDAQLTRSEREQLGAERDLLMKKLVEVEMDGQAAAKQVTSLRDMTHRLKEEKRLTTTDSTMLSKQKDLLIDRLADFEATNRGLRRMLRDRHEEEAASGRLAEQRDILLKKLSETEDRLQRSRAEILDKDRVIMDLRMMSDSQKEEHIAMTTMHSSLESNRAHLQKQLRQKEGDCNRMAVQIRSIESQLAQERIDVDHLQELLSQARGKAEKDKEALKKATRVQKQRATKSEDALEQMSAHSLERDTQIADLRLELDNYRARCDKLCKEKAHGDSEGHALRTRVQELERILERIEEDTNSKVENTSLRMQEKTAEIARMKLDNEQLKSNLVSCEDKLSVQDAEVSTLRSNLRQYETLVDEYRAQMNRSRREADDTLVQLEAQKQENTRIQRDGDSELDKNRKDLVKVILPRLRKAWVEKQGDQLDQTRDKLKQEFSEKKTSEARVEHMDRRLHDLELQNRDLLQTVAKREEAVHEATMRLDERNRENAGLSRQLEQALADTRRHSETVREKSAAKDRSAQSRILDLETQVSQTRAEIARIKREKEEAERKFNSRLYDLKDRLEQSHSTNRSMQNYVQFLKNSYANVFGDTSLAASSPVRGSTFH